jgi:hypothetical protein
MPRYTVTFTRTTRDRGSFTVVADNDEEAQQYADDVLADAMSADAEEDVAARLHENEGAITDVSVCWDITAIR